MMVSHFVCDQLCLSWRMCDDEGLHTFLVRNCLCDEGVIDDGLHFVVCVVTFRILVVEMFFLSAISSVM